MWLLSKPFVKATKNSNVTIVENHLLFCQTWEVISKPFMKVTKICEKSFTGLLLLGFISKQFKKITKISHVNIVENHILKLVIWESIWKPLMKIKKIALWKIIRITRVHIKTIHKCQKDFRCDFYGKSFSHSNDLRVFIKTIHKGLKGFECDACGNFSRR